MADLVERLRIVARTTVHVRFDAAEPFVADIIVEAADRIAALEAEAAEGERRGLERAAVVAEVIAGQMRAVQDEWRTPKNNLTARLVHDAFKHKADIANDVAAKIRALIPEAPAREAE